MGLQKAIHKVRHVFRRGTVQRHDWSAWITRLMDLWYEVESCCPRVVGDQEVFLVFLSICPLEFLVIGVVIQWQSHEFVNNDFN